MSFIGKTHNHFAPGTAVEKCGLCGKQFPTQSGLENHVGQKEVCDPWNKPKGWNVPYPTTQQERIDTWAYSKQGEVSEHLKVYPDENGELPEELPELPTPEMLAGTQSTNVNQQRASDPLTTGTDHNPNTVANESQQAVGSCQESPIIIDDDDEPNPSGGEQPHADLLKAVWNPLLSDFDWVELGWEAEAFEQTGMSLEQLAEWMATS